MTRHTPRSPWQRRCCADPCWCPRWPSKLSLGEQQQLSDSNRCRGNPHPHPRPAPPTALVCSGAWGRQGSRHLEKPCVLFFLSPS